MWGETERLVEDDRLLTSYLTRRTSVKQCFHLPCISVSTISASEILPTTTTHQLIAGIDPVVYLLVKCVTLLTSCVQKFL